VRVPAHLRELAEELQLRRWVYRSDFDREAYFGTIDGFITTLRTFHPEHHDPTNEELVPLIARVIDTEDLLATHVIDGGWSIGDADRWFRICTAAAWTVMQRYRLESENGKWPQP
jgi:hypothetical protein